MKENMVSIIIPVFNAGPYIVDTIDMVRAQTYRDWELILVNDRSKDDSAPIIKNYMRELPEAVSISSDDLKKDNYQSTDRLDMTAWTIDRSRVLFIDKKINEGAARARNTGLAAAEGRYIAFLDADDVWKPEKLELEMQFMKEHDAGFAFTAYEFGDKNAVATGKTCRVPLTLNYRQALSRTIIFTSTVLFDTQKVDKSLINMPEVESEDTATWWKILRSGITAYGLDIPLVIYRRPETSLSSNKGKAIKRIWKLYRKEEGLSIPYSSLLFMMWAFRATFRRLIPDHRK